MRSYTRQDWEEYLEGLEKMSGDGDTLAERMAETLRLVLDGECVPQSDLLAFAFIFEHANNMSEDDDEPEFKVGLN